MVASPTQAEELHMPDQKLIGQDSTTPDLVPKVTERAN